MSHIQPDATKRPPQIKGVYIALISQTGTAAPTAVVIKNTLPTLGMPTWGRTGVGNYTFTSSQPNYFPTGLVTMQITNNVGFSQVAIVHGDTEFITIGSGDGGFPLDAILAFTPIEITIWDRLQD